MKDNKIRFLATSDIHSDVNFMRVIDKYVNLEKIDFVIITGDISEKKDDFSTLLGIFKGKQIFMVPGNHENKKKIKALVENYNVHLVGNSPIKIDDDFAIFASNYIPFGPYSVHEEDIFTNLVANYDAIKDSKIKILLHHTPPHATLIGNASQFFPFISGSFALRHFLENFSPDIALVGHIHESSGLEEIVNKTKVINIAKTFRVFEFDRGKKTLI